MGSYIFLWLCILCLSITCNEINFTVKQSTSEYEHNIIYLFAHGLGANMHQATSSLQREIDISNKWIAYEPMALFNFKDVCSPNQLKKTEFIREKVCLGQENDIACLHEAYTKVRELFPDCGVILVGISRGASTILNYLASEYITTGDTDYIKAVVLESPFDSLSSVVKHLLDRYRLSWLPFSKQVAYKICHKYFPNVNPKGIFPIKVTDKIPAHIPIMLVHSKKDKVVPVTSSRNLYIKLRSTGNNHVYLVELLSGSHGKLLHGPDADLYFFSVHAFYKKYGLYCNENAAERGGWYLAQCQPDINALRKKKKSLLLDEDESDGTMDLSDEDLSDLMIENLVL